MAVVIRLRRMGHKKAPYFRLVVTDKRFKRDGRFLETVGTYHPLVKGDIKESIQKERIEYWIGQGAQPSETVWSILKRAGINKPNRKAKKTKVAAEGEKKSETVAAKETKKVPAKKESKKAAPKAAKKESKSKAKA